MTDEKPKNDFISDLVAAQTEMGNAVLNKVNPHFKSKYADISAVREATLPILNKHGFAIVQLLVVSGDNNLLLRTELAHISGEAKISHFPIPAGTAQQQGSAITYARRYSWSAICGIASEEDDDGEAAMAPAKPKSAYQSRKEGHYPVLEQGLREQTTIEGLKQYWIENLDYIRDLTPSWMEKLQEEKDRCKQKLIEEVAEDTEIRKQLKGSLV